MILSRFWRRAIVRRVFRGLIIIVLGFLFTASGCGRIGLAPNQAAQTAMQQQVQTLATQNQEYQSRATSLDRDNQELESLLAQSRQQTQLLTDELGATRTQLQSTTDQLLAMRSDNDQLRTKSTQLVATAQQRAGAEIRANNTLLKNLATKQMPGVEVRQDGDVVRVEAPADRVFMPGSNYLQNGGEQLLVSIAADLRQNFPDHIIGIEGHTDDAATHSQQFPTNHHLSAAQALAAYNLLVQKGTMAPTQLFVIGHGANHPVVSNASDAGKARNRRIEFVVYPERMAAR
jgi:flagellar motor protein MotB